MTSEMSFEYNHQSKQLMLTSIGGLTKSLFLGVLSPSEQLTSNHMVSQYVIIFAFEAQSLHLFFTAQLAGTEDKAGCKQS